MFSYNTHRFKIVSQWILPSAFLMVLFIQEMGLLFYSDYPPTIRGYCTYALEALTFFVSLAWIAPLAFDPSRKLQFFSRLLTLVVVHHVLRCVLAFRQSVHEGFLSFMYSADRLVLTAWRLEYVLGITFVIAALHHIGQRALERKQLQMELLAAKAERSRVESLLVQMQLNPHTLHNGLSYLEAQSRGHAPQMTEAMVLLSEVLEPLMINTQEVEKVPVSTSLSQIEKLIALQRLIHNDRQSLRVTSKVELGDNELLLPPSLLMPIIENLFKYGKLNDPESPATIDIKIDSGTLHLNTWNKKKRKTFPGNGIGLDSVRHILNYYYPGKHSLTTVDKDTEYAVSLTIQL